MSPFPRSVAIVSAAKSMLLAPSGNSSKSLSAALIHDTGGVFHASAMDNPMLSYMTTFSQVRTRSARRHLEKVQPLRLFGISPLFCSLVLAQKTIEINETRDC